MQIIKDKTVVDNNWTFIDDNAELINGNITVSFKRFQQEKETLFKREGAVGIRLNADDNVAELNADLGRLCLIELNFPNFADGRAFSQAWLLRNRFNYIGEIRAVGDYCADQLFYLSRVGVNAFEPFNSEDINVTLNKLNDFSVAYQASVN
jgi:uncharacterized protein (DUF934 family)